MNRKLFLATRPFIWSMEVQVLTSGNFSIVYLNSCFLDVSVGEKWIIPTVLSSSTECLGPSANCIDHSVILTSTSSIACQSSRNKQTLQHSPLHPKCKHFSLFLIFIYEKKTKRRNTLGHLYVPCYSVVTLFTVFHVFSSKCLHVEESAVLLQLRNWDAEKLKDSSHGLGKSVSEDKLKPGLNWDFLTSFQTYKENGSQHLSCLWPRNNAVSLWDVSGIKITQLTSVKQPPSIHPTHLTVCHELCGWEEAAGWCYRLSKKSQKDICSLSNSTKVWDCLQLLGQCSNLGTNLSIKCKRTSHVT